MHIVFICAEYPLKGRATGGFGRYVENISQTLIKQNTDVSIICCGDSYFETESQGRRIISLSPFFLNDSFLKKMPFLQRVIAFLEYPVVFSLKTAFTLVKLHKKHPISIIEGGDFGAETLFPLLFKKLRHLPPPIVIKLHTPSFVLRQFNEEGKSLFYVFIEALEKWCLKNVQAMYSPTKALSTMVSKEYGVENGFIIPYPIQIKKAHETVKRNKNQVLYVGKLQRKKGVFDLLHAVPNVLKTNPKTIFTFIGPDTLYKGLSTKNELQNLAQKLGVSYVVHVLDSLPQKKLLTEYQKTTILVVPSHWDNFPNVILEAGANKLSVIATDVGGISEMITHEETALLVSIKSPQELAVAMQFLLKDQKLQKKLGGNLYQDIQLKYNSAKVAELTREFYENVLKSTTRE